MSLPELFRVFLKTKGSSPVTTKNYVSDVVHFLNWLGRKTGIDYRVAGKSIFGLVTKETLEEYKDSQITANTPLATINRRLSSLRKLGQFAKSQGWILENPGEKVVNAPRQTTNGHLVEKILGNFRKHLEKEQVSRITIKNYLADLRDFLAWVETI